MSLLGVSYVNARLLSVNPVVVVRFAVTSSLVITGVSYSIWPVTIFLMNGVQIKGYVKGFDSYIVLLESENRQQNLIYKHAVSTIVPGKNINLQNTNQK